MSKRKFNLGEIIRKLNQESPEPAGTTPSEGTAQHKAPPPAAHSNTPPARPDTAPLSQSSSPLPSQPTLASGYTGRSFTTTPLGAPPQQEASKSLETTPVLRETDNWRSPPDQQPPSVRRVPAPETAEVKKSTFNQASPGDDDENEEEFDLFKYIGILLRRKYVILIVVLLSTILSLMRYMRSDSYYIASARLLFRPDNQEILGNQNMFRYWGDREKIFSTHLELLKSRTVLAIVAQNLGTETPPEAISGALNIKQGETAGEKNDIIEITYRNANAETARDVLNELCRSYIEYRRDVNAQEVTRLVKKFEYQIDKLEKELDLRESDLREFKESHRMVQLSSETNLTISKLSTMEMSLQETQLALLENKERLGALTTQISRQEQDIVQSVTYSDPFKNRISELELELNTLTTEYSSEHFKVKTLRQQIENLKSATVDSLTKKAASKTLVKNPIRQALLQELVNVTIEKSSLDAKRTAQEQLIDKLNQELIRLPSMEQKFANLQRETESLLQTVRMLKSKYEEAKIRRDSEESDLKLLELAQTPRNPLSTAKSTNIIIGILIGFILGIALALLIEYLDQSLKDPASVEKVLGLPLLGIVPFIEADHALLEQVTDVTKNILEPFRALRANIKHLATTHHLQTFIICSAIKGEGKTTLGANLAITFALDGKKVILVDGDLRRSQVHTLFGISKTTGLSDYLLGNATLDEILKPTRIENMSLVTSGERPHNPAELLGTIRFDQLVTELRQKADIVIFDSPALLPVSDTITMAPKMDGVLFVVRTFWTPLKAAKQALNQLERIGSHLFGGILNGASHSGKQYPYYYGYYGYYGYYSYKYSYDDDHTEKLSVRTAGLFIEKKFKETLLSFTLATPKLIGSASKGAAKLTRKKRFWTLLLLLLAISGGRVYQRNNHRYETAETVEYVGMTSAPPTDTSDQLTLPQHDMAFTGNKMSRPLPPEILQNASTPDTGGLAAAINSWHDAFTKKREKAYLAYYDRKSFRFPGGGISQWEEQTSDFFTHDSASSYGTIRDMRTLLAKNRYAELMIEYPITTARGSAIRRTAITWSKTDTLWRITEEKQLSTTYAGAEGE